MFGYTNINLKTYVDTTNNNITIQNILFLYILLIIGLSLKIITHAINGNIKTNGLYLNAWTKSKRNIEIHALVIPQPGQGIPVISFNIQLHTPNRYVINIYKANINSIIQYFFINLNNNLKYSLTILITI